MIEDLVLARVLAGPSRPSLPKLARDLAPLLPRDPGIGAFRAAVASLREGGELASVGLAPTERGRARALAFLGLASLPPRWNWRTIRTRALPCRALGLSPTAPASARVLRDEDRLSAALLVRTFGLPAAAAGSLRGALEALVCRELGHPDCASFDDLMRGVLGRKLGDAALDVKAVRRLTPRVLLGANGVPALRDALVAAWTAEHAAEAPAAEALPVDASAVLTAAREAREGRFGDKVLVHHVHEALPTGRPSLEAFKRALVELNATGAVALARADLVQLHDPDELARAEVQVGDARFHFVRIGRTS